MYTPSEPDPLHQLLLQNMTPDGIPTLPKDNATLLKAVLHSNSPLLRTAAAKLVSTAENGSPSEQQVAGMIYLLGLGLEPNPEKAAQWFLKAARRGNANAQCRLAECYDYGIGLSQDHPLAAYWYTKAATQGDPLAQYQLGLLYIRGAGVPEDPCQAIRWFRKAAMQGEPASQLTLGIFYTEGIVVKRNPAQGTRWLRKAAMQGIADAQYYLAICYETGEGVRPNPCQSPALAATRRRPAAPGSNRAARPLPGHLIPLHPSRNKITPLHRIFSLDITPGNYYLRGELDQPRNTPRLTTLNTLIVPSP